MGAPSFRTKVQAGGFAGVVARGRARRQRRFNGKELVLDFLIPNGRRRPNTRGKRDQPHLPDELFAVIAGYYWCGELTAEDEAVASEAEAVASEAEAEADEEPE